MKNEIKCNSVVMNITGIRFRTNNDFNIHTIQNFHCLLQYKAKYKKVSIYIMLVQINEIGFLVKNFCVMNYIEG